MQTQRSMINHTDPFALADLANELGNKTLRKPGFRMDAVFCCLACLQKIQGKNRNFINSVLLEIGTKGLRGFTFSRSDYSIDCLQMTGVSGLCMSCYLYCLANAVGIDSGLAINDEYALAAQMLDMQNK